eukprot:710257_1
MASTVNGTGTRFFEITFLLNIYKKVYQIFGYKRLVILAAICGIILKYRVKKHKIPSAPMYLPIVGHLRFAHKYFGRIHPEGSDFLDVETEILQKLGKDNALFVIQIPQRTQVFVADPQIIDSVFRLRFNDANKGEQSFGPFRFLLGDGIFASNGLQWKRHRSVASHMFTVRALRDYMFEVFVATTDRLMNKFDELHHNGSLTVDVYDMWNRLTFEAFTTVAFGADVNAIGVAPQQCEFGYRFDQALALVTQRIFSVLDWKLMKRFRFIPFVAPYEVELHKHSEWLETFIMNVINDRKEELKAKRELKYDLLSMFMEDNNKISDKELRDIAFNFIIAGKDTTAQALSWFMYILLGGKFGDLKHIEANIRDEIKKVFGCKQYEDNTIKLTFKTVGQCKYIECCLKETLRLYPSVPHLVRTVVKDIRTHNGYTIKKGEEVYACAYAMGRLPWIWEDPLKFKPERFKGSAKDEPDPSKYPAFNIAPRLCVGKHVALMEAKIAIVQLFAKYKNIRAVENQNVQWVPSPTMQMSEGFKCYLS